MGEPSVVDLQRGSNLSLSIEGSTIEKVENSTMTIEECAMSRGGQQALLQTDSSARASKGSLKMILSTKKCKKYNKKAAKKGQPALCYGYIPDKCEIEVTIKYYALPNGVSIAHRVDWKRDVPTCPTVKQVKMKTSESCKYTYPKKCYNKKDQLPVCGLGLEGVGFKFNPFEYSGSLVEEDDYESVL